VQGGGVAGVRVACRSARVAGRAGSMLACVSGVASREETAWDGGRHAGRYEVEESSVIQPEW